MFRKILIMGLPGAGKTTLAEALVKQLKEDGHTVEWINADKVRSEHDDWDFTHIGRHRQSTRMRKLANKSTAKYVIVDFVAPLEKLRKMFDANYTVWVDTIDKSRYEDTNKIFEPPATYFVRVTEQDADKWAKIIAKKIYE